MIREAQSVLPCADLDATLAFFVDRLGFRVEAISPADDPEVAVIAGHGLRLRLVRGGTVAPGSIRLLCDEPGAVAGGATTLISPDGTRVELVAADPPLVVPPLVERFVLTRAREAAWHAGRAGMRYRDLLPDRLGGRFVASQIAIPEGGPVPDYVHFHAIRFQMIYCRAGWVRVVYEDQGPAFTMEEGDCVLQPPRIRHRVLEASPGLEVIEIGCPARHDTFADPALALPTQALRPGRDFGGQRFVRHEAARASWGPWRVAGFVCRDTGIAAATDGLAGARVVRPAGAPAPGLFVHDGELAFLFVLAGGATLRVGADSHRLESGDAVAIPAGLAHALADCAADLELLDVTLPAG